ncbi:Gfo/Idh/MocA family protein [Truepera radiovictrix]|uniref:Oxidoreductase domain protein n=1 Tax=Truepera radiovictrix (strain DSM 17093 / CIP 108686 / LMG 22925 / RQ-24) TaxID=649638 RepID=D7CQH4_TRURR|nr:Gfo/Idh/MocA family oxidoreductase [Truepera radiovictrix]ADI14958.1 oxidoreductase domain protein [Truepera radiovictrix DSM 17093]WMT56487.1 Gfo/Idh/MocA family oxidoreductase [Truepera radiovictrix]
MDKLRVAVVGGGIGKAHLDAYLKLSEEIEVVAVCDLDLAKAQGLAETYRVPRVTRDLADLCRMEDLDVIDLCTPPQGHFEQIQQVLAAGKHVVCEKPLVGSLREADALIAAEAASQGRVMPIFQYRFGRGLQKLKHLVAQGVAGRAYLSTVETAWRRRASYYDVPWRGKWQTELGGALLSHAIHAHDMLTYILGSTKSVFARTATRVNPIEVEDCASVSLEFSDGSLASLSVTLGSPQEITRHRFCFENLVAESNTEPYNNSAEPWRFVGDTPEVDARIGAALARFEPLPERYEGQFFRFVRALRQGSALPVTLADARASLELVTAMYDSAQTGQDVTLPIGEDHPKYGGWLPQTVPAGG